MRKQPPTTRISAAAAKRAKGKTDWNRVRSQTDAEIKIAVAGDPDQSLADTDFWANARLVMPESKEKVSLRLDRDVLQFFRASGRRWQTRINAALRAFVEAHAKSR